jgi:hypothetical protein
VLNRPLAQQRPPMHMQILVDTDKLAREKGILSDDDNEVSIQ